LAIVRDHPVGSAEINGLRAAAWDAVGDQQWEPILRRGLGWVCAVDGDRLVGFVNVAWDGGAHAFLLDTTVHPDAQHRGIGTLLVVEATAMAKDRGAEWLHVDFDDDLAPFYRACGFAPTAAGLLDLTTALVRRDR
jgi:GNAT superfamily N-acetyltransferase